MAQRIRDARERAIQSEWYFVKKYGLTLGEVEDLAEAQEFKCAICSTVPDRKDLVVDHDHTTNKIRALLCRKCNMAIGLLQDDPAIMVAAADYVRRHRDAE